MADEKVEEVPEKFKSPLGVTSDDEDDKVRVCVVIPGLKKKMMASLAANAAVDCKFEVRSLDLKVILNNNSPGKEEKIRYYVRQLPNNVQPEKCRWKVKKDQVVISLHKAETKSWARELSEVGLETYVDENQAEDPEDY